MENIQTLLAAVAQTQGFDDDDDPLDFNSPQLGFQTPASSPMTPVEMGGPQLTGDSLESDDWSSVEVYPLPLAAVPAIGAGEKRKRGRPARGQVLPKLPPLPKRKKVEDEDEDVCFICFDGGSLVLCDKKGCPKAYHPACIKRDEAFFKTKAKWNCGWHICSVCRKNSHYMCYTCTYSLCKGCTKDADYVSVRGNKGFCSTCMKTIMLIENKDQANTESVQVDFDDKLSWEYLFKVYWVYLKEKLLLALSELTNAKKPWKGVSALACKPQSTTLHNTAIDGKISISYRTSQPLELNKPYEEISYPQSDRLKVEASAMDNHVETQNGGKVEVGPSHHKDAERPSMDRSTAQPSIVKGTDESGIGKASENPGVKEGDEDTNKPCICKHREEPRDRNQEKPTVLNTSEWASKDLLEFVAHMNNGDTSALSQFDVQRLLIDYIKRNNLRDPHQKSQIICDPRLTNLFGKSRVGHIEMLKLLEFHFPIKEDVQKNYFIPAGFVGSAASDMDIDGNSQSMPVKSRKRKTRKKTEERAPQNNLNEYAAIDFHNINLIFLRRNLMEILVEDKEIFNDKVIGSIVRIRISSNDQKPDVYRLVQVVGTSKVPEPYKIGDKIADVMLEVLNLDKKEAVSIDSISDQEFTEDECRRLRQSIRCGLMRQLTVGELLKKAMSLQPVKLNVWLEAEILRLNHLRDRASEKGHKKELRECVHKLQLLKSPEERKRRISQVPEIHADPKMSPTYESEEDSRTVVNSKKIQVDSRSVDNSKKDGYPKPIGSGFARSGRKSNSPIKMGKEDAHIHAQIRVNGTNSAISGGGNDQARQRSGLETSIAAAAHPVGNSPSADNIETEKLWHYRDPNGKIQGPFAMMQLRKWSTTGLFPPDMRIWTNYEQFDSLLLTDALNGKFHGASEWPRNSSSDTLKTVAAGGIGRSGCVSVIGEDSEQRVPASSNHVSEQKAAASSNHAIEQRAAASSNHAIEQRAAASSNHAIEQKAAASSNHAVDSSNHAVEQKEAASSNHGIDSSNLAVEQKEAASSNHGIDLSNHAVEQKEAASSNHGIDLSNHAGEQKEAALSNHAIKQVKTASSNHAIEQVETASSNHAIDLSNHAIEQVEAASSNHAIDLSNHAIEQKEEASSTHAIDLSDGNTGAVRADESGSSSWPQCWDLLKDNNSSAEDVQEHIVPPASSNEQTCAAPSDRGPESNEFNHVTQNGDINSSVQTQNQMIFGHELQDQSDNQGEAVPSSEENLTLPIDLMSSNDMESDPLFTPAADAIKQEKHVYVPDLHCPEPTTSNGNFGVETAEKQQSFSDVPLQSTGILELLSPAPRSNIEDQGVEATERKQPGLIDLSLPISGPSWTSLVMGDVGDDWGGYSPTPEKAPVQEWDHPGLVAASMRTHEVTNENVATTSTSNNNNPFSHHTSWLAMLNEPIEFDALGEESVSDLLAEVDAMESQQGGGGGFPSPTSAMKFAKELLLDCKDDCFSSIEEFSSTHDPGRSDAFSATGNNNNTIDLNPPIDALDSFRRSAVPVHSSASSEGETNNAPVYSSREGGTSEFHHSAPNNNMIIQDIFGTPPGSSESMDPGWGGVQGNINLVTVQGNVNLVLGGPGQGMANLNWGTNPGNPWVNPNMNPSPRNGSSLPWEGQQQQRKYGGGGDRFASPREWNNNYQGGGGGGGDAGFGRGRPPWGRQPYGGGGGGYSRPLPKGQRVCKFYESGRCKKGAFCDYLHP